MAVRRSNFLEGYGARPSIDLTALLETQSSTTSESRTAEQELN